LKCGLIHDEPTAICDGYAGLDPDETAGDSRKQAAARIRAILAAVPIESRPGGRGKRRAESTSAVAEMKPPAERAAPPAAGSATEAAEPEVPEWRREVSERLESYRQRREKQSRHGSNGQSVLEFRVHAKKENAEPESVAQDALPSADAAGIVLDSRLEQSMARVEAAAEANAEQFAGASAAAEAEVVMPRAMAAAAGAGAGSGAAAGRGFLSTLAGERVYAPADVRTPEHESASFEAPPSEFEELAYPTADTEAETFVPEAQTAMAAAELAPECASVSEEIPPGLPQPLPFAAEPGVVLADAATLEVHADPMEAEEVVSMGPGIAPAISPAAPVTESAIPIPPIDTEYWRTAPGIEPDAIFQTGDEECGSLTSPVDLPAAAEEMAAPEAAVAEGAEEAASAVLESAREELAPGETFHAPAEQPTEPGAADAPPWREALAGMANPAQTLFAEPAAETSGAESEKADPRREALRTASRRPQATPTERIEISVPQPVFDFSEAGALAEHPQDQHVPVADLRERRTAGAIDAVVLTLTVAGFFVAFHLAGGELALSRLGAAVVLAASFLIYAQYVLLFTLTAGATPGMMLRGLRVVCFDGTSPGTLELGWRAFGCLLSAAAGMLGFVWAAWDEDGLTWHDRISQTYITYAELEAEPVHAAIQ
jgi:uncharacterized RDD family membrane protein YckC